MDTSVASPQSQDRSASIFGNAISPRDYRNAVKTKQRYAKRFGDDSDQPHRLRVQPLPVIGDRFGAQGLAPAPASDPRISLAGDRPPIIIGNIRMGFGHYRISMAMASAAHALGFAPYWLDLCAFPDSTCSKVIGHQNDMYSFGSRLSQRSRLFNRLVWEPMNSEGFRRLTYNAKDQKVAELYAPVLADLPHDVPFVAAHAWPAQAAVHARLTRVVNAIPDNWPMALHLAEGSLHAVQTPSSYLGYRQLRGMDPDRDLIPMPSESLAYVGHYVDHELVAGAADDCAARKSRLAAGEPVRYLLTVGGAGAQGDLFAAIVSHLMPYVEAGQAALLVNVGDHADVWEQLAAKVPALSGATRHFGDFGEVERLADSLLAGESLTGVHAFCDNDVFAAVYATNLLMRVSDVLVTKPSELSFYPVPKLMICRVGGHEAWGAVRAAEVGDGTYELRKPGEVCAMIDSMQHDHALITDMCDHIADNARSGLYDGAYRVVRLASEMGDRR